MGNRGGVGAVRRSRRGLTGPYKSLYASSYSRDLLSIFVWLTQLFGETLLEMMVVVGWMLGRRR